jgi:hypothetical protein
MLILLAITFNIHLWDWIRRAVNTPHFEVFIFHSFCAIVIIFFTVNVLITRFIMQNSNFVHTMPWMRKSSLMLSTTWLEGHTASFQHFSVFIFDVSCVIIIIFFTFLVLFHTIYCAIHSRHIYSASKKISISIMFPTTCLEATVHNFDYFKNP